MSCKILLLLPLVNRVEGIVRHHYCELSYLYLVVGAPTWAKYVLHVKEVFLLVNLFLFTSSYNLESKQNNEEKYRYLCIYIYVDRYEYILIVVTHPLCRNHGVVHKKMLSQQLGDLENCSKVSGVSPKHHLLRFQSLAQCRT